MQKGKCITCEAEILGYGYCSKKCSEKDYTEEELIYDLNEMK